MTTKSNTQNQEVELFIGKLVSFNNSLKLHHWHVTGHGSYSKHIALDQAIESLTGITDRIVETTYALEGDLFIIIPETGNSNDVLMLAENIYQYVESKRDLFPESFSQSIIDDYQEAVIQLFYRLKRLE